METVEEHVRAQQACVSGGPIELRQVTARGQFPLLGTLSTILALAIVYFIAGKFGLMLAFVHTNATAVWPPTGIALAAFLVLGYRIWPGIFLGAFLVNVTTAGSFATSIGIAIGNTLEGAVGAYLVARFARGCQVMNRSQDIFKFMILAGMLSTVVSATLGASSLCLGGVAQWADYGSIWLTWWLGDAAGALLVAPTLLLWAVNPHIRWERKKFFELFLLVLLLCLVSMIVFGGLISAKPRNYPLDFLCLPILIWAAFRFSQRETATAVLIASGIAIWGTLSGFGPFVQQNPNESLLLLQVFMGVTSVTVMAIAATVSERKSSQEALRQAHSELDSRIQERTKELQLQTENLARSNTELNQFATVVSHELQEPLRKILTFGELLKSLKAQPDQEEWQYAQKMEGAAKRMQRLVQDLLNLSRVTTDVKPLESVDLNEVLREISTDFQVRLAQIGAQMEVGLLPVLKADSLQMRQLFENLVSNAYKFRKNDEPLHITVLCPSREPRNGFATVMVKDNGIGFDEKYADRIFKPFERLHRRGEYPGSGMGLAICRRILMRHGGEITARSKSGEGSVFIVTLPA